MKATVEQVYQDAVRLWLESGNSQSGIWATTDEISLGPLSVGDVLFVEFTKAPTEKPVDTQR